MPIWIKIRDQPADTIAQSVERRHDRPKSLGFNPRKCQIINFFHCVPSSEPPLQSIGRSNFDKGLHNLIKLIQKR